jgi:hypothetical protein
VRNYTFPLGKDPYPELRPLLFTAAFLMVWAIGPYRFHSRLCEYLSCHCLCLDKHRKLNLGEVGHQKRKPWPEIAAMFNAGDFFGLCCGQQRLGENGDGT